VLSSGTEADRQDVFLNEALTFIRENPLSAASLFARKMRTFWWRIDSDPRDYSPAAALAYEVIFRTELVLALFGTFTLFRSPWESPPAPHRAAAVFSIALMVAISVLQSMFYVQGRHRFLIEPLLLMFTACGILALIRVWSAAKGGDDAPAAGKVPRLPGSADDDGQPVKAIVPDRR
jgi:hypothetical protein